MIITIFLPNKERKDGVFHPLPLFHRQLEAEKLRYEL